MIMDKNGVSSEKHYKSSSSSSSNTTTAPGSCASALPAEIVEQILYLTDPETFASLVLLNRAWRAASETPRLYAYHLSRCPSWSASNNVLAGPFGDDGLPRLKRQFFREIKRNLFNVFLRPRQTTINLISSTASSSAAFPGGEAFEFAFSPRAQWCLAISSSRIYVVDTASPTVSVARELKVVRRPLSAHILSDGSRLAVLSSAHNLNLYDLSGERVRFLRSVALDNPPHAITMSPGGELVAAASEGGIEICSLAENAAASDRRYVKCDRVDSLEFSCNGSMLLGTARSKSPATVVLSAPYFSGIENHSHSDMMGRMWTQQILFPSSSRDCSHAALLPRKNHQDDGWCLTYDRVFESFRAVRADDLRNGTTWLVGPRPRTPEESQRTKSTFAPCALPTITSKGELVAAAFLGSEVWLYGVPEDLDAAALPHHGAPRLGSAFPDSGAETGPITSANGAFPHADPCPEGLPRWQVLVDENRNVFSRGRRVAKVQGVSSLCWASNCGAGGTDVGRSCERLIIAAPGGVSGSPELEQEDMASVDGGRLVVLDFEWTAEGGKRDEVTIELGNVEPQLLEEERTDMDTEIALVRRRTVALRPSARADADEMPPMPLAAVGFGLDSIVVEAPAHPDPVATEAAEDGMTLEEAAAAFDNPYSHTNPRSRSTLYRSATALEANRRRNPARRPSSGDGQVQFRRRDGTEMPDESDADNWVPPPPPYSEEPDEPLPAHLRRVLLPPGDMNDGPSGAFAGLVRTRSNTEGSIRSAGSPVSDISPRHSLRRPPHMGLQGGGSSPPGSEPNSYAYPSIGTSRPVSEISLSTSPISVTSPRRRPVSILEPRSSALRGPHSLQPGPSFPDARPFPPPLSRSASLRRNAPTSPSLTLSGSNLQQRLEYPLPPIPPRARQHDPTSPELPSPPSSRDQDLPIAVSGPPSPLDAPIAAASAHHLRDRIGPAAYDMPSSLNWPIRHGFSTPSSPSSAPCAAGNRSAHLHSSSHGPSSSSSSSVAAAAAPFPILSTSHALRHGLFADNHSTPNLHRPPAHRFDTGRSLADDDRPATATRPGSPATVRRPQTPSIFGRRRRRRSTMLSRARSTEPFQEPMPDLPRGGGWFGRTRPRTAVADDDEALPDTSSDGFPPAAVDDDDAAETTKKKGMRCMVM